MNRRLTLVALAFALSGSAFAQVAPNTPKGGVRLTSVFPGGSGPDAVARIVAEKLQAKWGQPVIVDAKPGGAGVIGINAVKGQPPTGNDLVVVDVGNLSINPLIFKKLAYDPEKDLVPVAVLYKTAFFVAVAAETYGSNAVGGPLHLGAARFESAIGSDMLHVPFKETSQLYSAVATGEVSWAFGSIATAGPLVRGGKLRFLAVADRTRSAAMPDVPTLEEAGGPKALDALTWVALMAPAGTPSAVTAEINRSVNEALGQTDVKEKFAAFGFVPAPGPVQQVTELMQGDRARYAKVLERVKVSID
jgi:tripartite-type tricarboxylate transporter receptor subunit TctC